MKTLEQKIKLIRIDPKNRTEIEYSVAKFIEAYSATDNVDSRQAASALASRLLASAS
jgi:hypothetical protein